MNKEQLEVAANYKGRGVLTDLSITNVQLFKITAL